MAKKKYVISKGKLNALYHKRRLSTFKIAKIFNCTAGTIVNRMRECNIKRRHSGPKRVNISRDGLYLLYIKKEFSARKIARICHCDQTAILNKLRKYNIPIRHPKQKIVISKKELEQLYTEEGLSTYKIAKIFGCAPSAIYRYLKLYKIKTRPLKRINISKKELRTLYINKGLHSGKIANIYNCSPIVILDKMREYGISIRSPSEVRTRRPKTDFNGSLAQKAYIIGFRIGDLGVRKDFNLIRVNCGTTKNDQVRLIKTIFAPFGPIYIGNRDKRGAIHVSCSLNSSFKFLLPKHNSIPKWILRNKKHFLQFLAGYTDAEGNIGISDGAARFRIRSYDKEILKDINNRLQKLDIRSLFRLDRKAHIDKRGVVQRKDSWGVLISERESLLKLFKKLEPLVKHKKRKGDLLKAKKNVILRLKN